MQEALIGRLKEVLSDVMEKMFYMVPDDLEGESPSRDGEYLAEISIEGKRRITLQFLLPESLAKQMASNFLPGREPSEEMVQDVLREMANMVGGNLISGMGGDWRLGLPRVHQGIEAYGAVLGREPVCEFDVEGDPLYVYLQVG